MATGTRNRKQRPAGTEYVAELANRYSPHRFGAWASDGQFKAFRHIAYTGERIARAVRRGGGRLIICWPPGHGKSSLLSKWTPTWFLDNNPTRRVMLTSHSAELAATWGRVVRNEFEHNERLFTKLSEDSSAANRWNTPEGGGMVAAGVGGGITGFRGDLVLVDDPHPTWEAAYSTTQRERVVEWFNGTLYDRLEPNATIVLLMHRWHESDLAGYLIEQHPDPWEVIRLPAIAEESDVLGRAPGEALCPERYDVAALKQIQAAVGIQVWGSKYQQNPLAVGGRVYHAFLPERNEDKTLGLRFDLPLQVSFDFNYNPGMHAVLGQYDATADCFSAVHEVHGPYMRVPACLNGVIDLVEKVAGVGKFPWPSLDVFGDPAGHQNRAETTETAWQQVQKRLETWVRGMGKPFRFRVPNGQYPVKTRVDTFNEALCDALGNVHYKIHPANCPRLLEDFKRLKADEQGLVDKRDESLSHASEAEANRVCKLRPIRRVVPVKSQVIFSRAAG